MGKRSLLEQIILGEATIKIPDEDMSAMKRVVASAIRSRRLPLGADKWLTDISPPNQRRASDQPKPAPAANKPTVKASPASSPEPDSRSGRIIPATNRFRQPDDAEGGPSHGKPSIGMRSDQGPDREPLGGLSVSRGMTGPTRGTPRLSSEPESPDEPSAEPPSSGPGKLARAWAALRGRDPENDLPLPKKASVKVKGGKARNLPNFDKAFMGKDPDAIPPAKTGSDDPLSQWSNKKPSVAGPHSDVDSNDSHGDDEYHSPFKGLGIDSTDDADDDPKLKSVARSLAKAKAKEKGGSDDDDDFDDEEDTDVDVLPAGQAAGMKKPKSADVLRQMFMANRRGK